MRRRGRTSGAVGATLKPLGGNSVVEVSARAEGLKKQRLPTVREIAGEALQQALREKMKEGVMEALRPLEQSLGAVERTLGVVERRLGAVDERLDGLAKIVVAGSNRAARMHNRTTGIACGQLQQLHKERRLKPTAAVSAADGFGSLPPQGVFPPTMEALHGEWTHARMDALADFYEEDFGRRSMLLAQRRALFLAFITRV